MKNQNINQTNTRSSKSLSTPKVSRTSLNRPNLFSMVILLSVISIFAMGGDYVQTADAATTTFDTDTQININFTIDSEDQWIINSGVTVTVNAPFFLHNNGTITNNGILNISGIFDNSATINNAGTFNNDATTNNFGTITNTGTLNNNNAFNNNGTITNNSIISNEGTLTNNAGATITNNNGGSLYNNNFNSKMTNSGTITNNAGGSFYNNGDFDNFGTIENNASGLIVNSGSSTFINYGTINNNSGATIDNNFGTLTNNSGGTIDNNGTINNSGTIANSGSLNNDCTGTISGTVSGNAIVDICDFSGPQNFTVDTTINVDATIGSGETWTITNGVTVTIASGVTVTNDGTIVINSGGILNNGGLINSSGTITNNGTLGNYCTATITGSITGNAILDICDYSGNQNFTADTTINVDATIGSGKSWTIDSGVTVTISSGARVVNEGTLTNNGTIIINSSSILFINTGTLDNSGTIINNGTLNINFNGILNNNAGSITNNQTFLTLGTINNFGTITNTGTFTNNSGIINNDCNGIITGDVTGTQPLNICDYSGNFTFNSNVVIHNNAIVSSGETWIISSGITVIIDSGVTVTNAGTITNTGTLNNTGTLTNSGSLNNNLNDTINNSGTITNTGSITNSLFATINNTGTITNDCSGLLFGIISTSPNAIVDVCDFSGPQNFTVDTTINVDATISNTETWTIQSGITVTIASGVTVISAGTLNNNGTFENNGVLTNSGGTINNSGTLENTGSFNIISGTFNNFGNSSNLNGGIISIDGVLNNNLGATLTNNVGGTIIHISFETINNSGTITNTGTFENNGTLNNDCTGTITGTITGTSTITGTCFPTFVSAITVNPSQIEVTMSDPIDYMGNASPQDFSISGSPGVSSVNNFTVSGNVVTINLTGNVLFGETITLSYTQPGNGLLHDPYGGEVASFFNQPITNNVANNPPVLGTIGNQIVDEESLLTFILNATDAETSSLNFGVEPSTIGATINPITNVFTWTPTESQGGSTYNFEIIVDDGILFDSELFTITVGEVNNPPVLGSIGPQSVNALDLLTFTATATDSDEPSNNLVFSLETASAPFGTAITFGGAFTWTPTEAQSGTHTIKIIVYDGTVVDFENIIVTVSDQTALPPVITTSDVTTTTNPLTITGTGESGATVRVTKGPSSFPTTVNSVGDWSIPIQLNEGANILTATQTDTSNNISGVSNSVTITLDVTAPTFDVDGNTSDFTTTILVGGTYIQGTIQNIFDAFSTTTPSVSGDTVDTSNVSTFQVTYTVSDSLGNAKTITETVDVLDATAPILNKLTLQKLGNSPIDGKYYSKDGDTIRLTVEPSEPIKQPVVTFTTVNNSTITWTEEGNDWLGTFTILAGSSEGEVDFTLEFVDLLGTPVNGSPLDKSDLTDGGVIIDNTKPSFVSAKFISANSLEITFDEPLFAVVLSIFNANYGTGGTCTIDTVPVYVGNTAIATCAAGSTPIQSDDTGVISNMLFLDRAGNFQVDSPPYTIDAASSSISLNADETHSVSPDSLVKDIDASSATNPKLSFTTTSTPQSAIEIITPGSIAIVTIPANAIINGSGSAPTIEMSVFTGSITSGLPAGAIIGTVVDLGDSGNTLTFSVPVKVQLMGQAGNNPFFVAAGSTIATPVLACSSTYTNGAAALADPLITVDSLTSACYYNEGADLSIWTTHFTGFGSSSTPAESTKKGGGCNDCEPPTLGLDSNYKRIVDNGFTYNGKSVDAERFFTPYPLITVNIGEPNTAVFKIYENNGIQNIKHVSFAFGLASDDIISNSKAMIELDIDYDGTETVTVTDPKNALDNIDVSTDVVDCISGNTAQCLEVTIQHMFRAPLDFNIVATDVWDQKRNAWQNYFNHGIEVIGESMNPPEKYDGTNRGQIYHLTETSKTTAVDEFDNTWSLTLGKWSMDYIPAERPQDGPTDVMTRTHSDFVNYKESQIKNAIEQLLEQCPTCLDDAYADFDDSFAYDLPTLLQKLQDPEVQRKMLLENDKAQEIMNQIVRLSDRSSDNMSQYAEKRDLGTILQQERNQQAKPIFTETAYVTTAMKNNVLMVSGDVAQGDVSVKVSLFIHYADGTSKHYFLPVLSDGSFYMNIPAIYVEKLVINHDGILLE